MSSNSRNGTCARTWVFLLVTSLTGGSFAAVGKPPSKTAVARAAASAGPYDLGYVRDPSTLEMKTLIDWHEEPGDFPTRQKLVEITVCEWWPGRKIRIPLVFVAPAGGEAKGLIVANMSFRAKRVTPSDLHRRMVSRGVGFVHAAIDRIDRMEPGGALRRAVDEMYLKTKSVRYTGTWLWGMSYMRAATAALSEPHVFSGAKIGATGGSKRGKAAAVAAIHDDRFTAIVPIVSSAIESPPALANGGISPSREVREADKRFWEDVAHGRTSLTPKEIDNLKQQERRMRNMGPGRQQMMAAGWSREEIERVVRELENLGLIGRHPELLRNPRFDFFYNFGSNDNITPGLMRLGRATPRFPAYILPGGQHGIDGVGFRNRTPLSPQVRANQLAFFSNHFFGDRPMMKTPVVTWEPEGELVRVRATFEEGPFPEASELHWSYDRAPVGSHFYNYSEWQSAAMRRVSDSEWVGEFPARESAMWADVLTTHSGEVNDMPAHASSPYVRLPLGVRLISDIRYREGASKAWRLDLALPVKDSRRPRPALVFVHGGGWRGGDKLQGFTELALEYARKGYVAIAPNYRLSGEAPFPAAVEDVKCAVRWLRAHAQEYNVDPNRIGGYGNSAGAHLVAMLGLVGREAGLEGDGPYQDQSSLLQAVVPSAVPTDFTSWNEEFNSWETAVLPFLAGPKKTFMKRARQASPITYVRGNAPRFLVIHGTADRTVPFDQAERFVAALKQAAARDVVFLSYDGAGHGVFREHRDETEPAMEKFLATHILNVVPGTQRMTEPPTFSNVSYGPHERHVLDFWQAESAEPAPLVIFIHGGGFSRGDKMIGPGKYGVVLKLCLESGISVASINYRLRPETPLWESIRDGARAVQFLRYKAAEWNIDPARVAAFGGSAGAGMSLWTAYHDDLANPNSDDPVERQSSRLTCVSSWAGQASYDPKFWTELLGPQPGVEKAPAAAAQLWITSKPYKLTPAEMQAKYDEVAAIKLVTPDDPPAFLCSSYPQGPPTDQASYVHHPKHHDALAEKLRSAGVRWVKRHESDYAKKGLVYQDAARRELVDFFLEQFGMPPQNYLGRAARADTLEKAH